MLRFSRFFPALLMILIFAVPAYAHRVSIYAWVEGGQVHTQSRFSKNHPVKQGTVDVIDTATGKILLSGPVTEEGEFVFDIPEEVRTAPRDLTLIVNAGEGHKGDWKLEASELGASSAPAETTPAAPAAATTEATAPSAPTPAALPAETSAQFNAQLEQTLNKVLEQKLAPLRRQLAEAEDSGPGLNDIIGGIGWLLGLAGIAAWFQSRKKA